MKRFEAFFTGPSAKLIMEDGFVLEARFDIIADSKERALELIEEEGSNPDEFYLEETNCNKTQMGRDLAEGISDARLLP